MSLKLSLLLSLLAFFLAFHKAAGRPSPMPRTDASKEVMNKLQNIFKVVQGIMVYNIKLAVQERKDVEIVCAERRAGKSYCKEVENYIEAARLDKIDPKEFAKFKQYFTDDLEQPQTVVATRMHFDESPCKSKTQIIYPKAAMSEDAQWLLVVQHGQYKQGVLVEECEEEVLPGEENSTLPLEDIVTSKQNFGYRKLVVLVNGEMKEKMVKLPSNCECRM